MSLNYNYNYQLLIVLLFLSIKILGPFILVKGHSDIFDRL